VPVEIDPLTALAEGDPPVQDGGLRHHVLFRPSFHFESLLTVDLAATATVRLRYFATSLWEVLTLHSLALQNASTPAEAAAVPPVKLPKIHETRAILTTSRSEQLRADLARTLPGLAAPDDRRGLDGITLHVELHTSDAPPRRYKAWSPSPDIPQHAYFATLHALATEALTDEQAQSRLATLHSYLDLGLPARDRGGDPRCLQIFGRLSSSHEAALTAFFATASETEAVVVDMRYFDGMGTLLYPLFRRFSRRPGATGWAVSTMARRQLREAQVPGDQLRDDLADTILLVTVRDAERYVRRP